MSMVVNMYGKNDSHLQPFEETLDYIQQKVTSRIGLCLQKANLTIYSPTVQTAIVVLVGSLS